MRRFCLVTNAASRIQNWIVGVGQPINLLHCEPPAGRPTLHPQTRPAPDTTQRKADTGACVSVGPLGLVQESFRWADRVTDWVSPDLLMHHVVQSPCTADRQLHYTAFKCTVLLLNAPCTAGNVSKSEELETFQGHLHIYTLRSGCCMESCLSSCCAHVKPHSP